MFTLNSARDLTQDLLQKGVIETMAKSSAVLEEIPFVSVVGSGYSYNVMSELPTVAYRAVNTGYTPDAPEIEKQTEHLVILGGNVDTDNFYIRTMSNINDIRSIQTEAKAKATALQFERDFFVGDGTGNALKGLDKRLTEGVAGTKITAALSLDALNELLDSVNNGASVLYMSKKMRRKVLALLQASNHYIEQGQDAFGRPVSMYGGVKIRAVDDSLIPSDKIYAVNFDVTDGVHGISNGDIMVRDLGEIAEKPCMRTVIEWYVGLATKHTKCFAVLDATSMRTAKATK